jgi:ribosome-binding factor A
MKRARGFDRTERIADLIQKSLAQMLLEDRAGEGFHFVTITGVVVSRDCSYAKIYVSVLEDEEEKIKHIVKLLNKSAKALRYQLAQNVKLRIVPELKFVYDESTAHGFRISTLIDSALKKSDKK